MKSVNLIDLVGSPLQSVVTYTYIGNQMYLFGLDTTKSFLKNKISNSTRTLSVLKKSDSLV
jgi:hypothetical protein